MGWGVCDPSEISKCDRSYTTFNTGHRQGGDPEEETHGVGGPTHLGRGCPGSALPIRERELVLPGAGKKDTRGRCSPSNLWAPGAREQDTHCKCLKVMSGKPVARDPEGERQRAST